MGCLRQTFMSSEVFLPSRNTHPQITAWLVLNWLSGWDSGKQKSDIQKLVDGSLGCSWSVATVSILLAPFCHCQMTQRSKLLLDKKPLWPFLDRRWIYPYVLSNLPFGKLYFVLTLSCSCCVCRGAGFACGCVSLCAVVQLHLSAEARASGKEF